MNQHSNNSRFSVSTSCDSLASSIPFDEAYRILSFVRPVIVGFDNQKTRCLCEVGRMRFVPRFAPRTDSIHSEHSIRLFNQLTVSIDKW